MRFIVEVRIEDEDCPRTPPVTVGVIERSADLGSMSFRVESSNLILLPQG